MRRVLLLAPLALLLAGCGARPQQAVGVSKGPTLHYLLCPGQKLEQVELTSASGKTLWQRKFANGTTRTAFRVPVRPGAIVSGPDGGPAMHLQPVPESGIRRGDGRIVSAAAFAAGRDSYCQSRRQDRAAAVAIGFAFVCLALLFVNRWLRSRRSRDPYRRPWLLRWGDGRDRPGP